jgi:hypothetical protein
MLYYYYVGGEEKASTAPSRLLQHGMDSLHYANLIRRTGPIVFFQPT